MAKKQKSVEEKLDDLALIVRSGLEEVRAGSKALTMRFEAVEERLERIEF
jgi:hypothetical protein